MALLTAAQRDRLCWLLPAIPVIRADLENARVLSEYPSKDTCRFGLLRFSLYFAIRGVTHKATHFATELIDPLLHNASVDYLDTPVLIGKGRSRRAQSAHFEAIRRHRTAVIAHSVKLWPEHEEAVRDIRRKFGTVPLLLLGVLDEIEQIAHRLVERGLSSGMPTYVNHEGRFTFQQGDLERLIAAANSLASSPSAP